MKQSIAALLLAVLVLLPACGAQPVPEAPWQTACRETGAYLQTQGAPTAGSIGGEWAVIGLSRAGLLSDTAARSYERSVEDYVQQAGSVRLHHAKSTENSRTILGLTAAGREGRTGGRDGFYSEAAVTAVGVSSSHRGMREIQSRISGAFTGVFSRAEKMKTHFSFK